MVFYREGLRDAVPNPQQLANKRHEAGQAKKEGGQDEDAGAEV